MLDLGYNSYFNSQPHKEADFQHTWRTCTSAYFNSQPHKEADVGEPPGEEKS